jgi:hypothetical protein
MHRLSFFAALALVFGSTQALPDEKDCDKRQQNGRLVP